MAEATTTDAPASTTTAPNAATTQVEAPAFTPPATQADLDRIVGERLARERSKFADYDDLKTKAAEFDKLAESQKTELQRAQEAATTAATRAAELEARLRESTITTAVVSLASSLGAVDPSAVVALLPKDAVTIDDAGQVTGAEAAVQALLDEKPYLKAGAAPAGFPDLGQGSRSRVDQNALNGDPLLQALTQKVGATPRRR